MCVFRSFKRIYPIARFVLTFGFRAQVRSPHHRCLPDVVKTLKTHRMAFFSHNEALSRLIEGGLGIDDGVMGRQRRCMISLQKPAERFVFPSFVCFGRSRLKPGFLTLKALTRKSSKYLL